MREAGVDLIYRSAIYFSALSAIHKKSEPPDWEAPKSYWLRPAGLMTYQILD